jgi:hypothetical protein
MDHAEEHQPHVAAEVNVSGCIASGFLLRARGDQDDPRTEQHRENRPHLAFEQHRIDRPHPVIGGGPIADDRRIVIGPVRQAHSDDVHQQDAEQCDTAEHVDRRDALTPHDRSRSGRVNH